MRDAWGIRHLDVDAPLPAVSADANQRGVTVVLWLAGVPLGQLDLLAEELPIGPAALQALAPRAIAPAVGDLLFGRGFEAPLPVRGRVEQPVPDLGTLLATPAPLDALREKLALPAPPPGGMLSVVVCTRDRPDQLARCLASLEADPGWIAEVVVVDNGTQHAATRDAAERFPRVRVVQEPRPGLSIARNTGLRRARCDLVAFTDDDVVVHRDWAARMALAFADPGTASVTGLVLPKALETPAQMVFERDLGGFGQGYRRLAYDAAFFRQMLPLGVPVWRIGAGASMALRRQAVVAVGGFDERLGAGAAGCSEDSELWYRLLNAGLTCRYEPSAVVFHEHRREWAALRRQMHDYMRGHVAALLVQYGRHRHAGNLRRLLLAMPRYYATLLARAAFHGRLGGRTRLIGTELRGALAGLGALRWALARPPAGGGATPLPREETAR